MWPFLASLAGAAIPAIASAFGQSRANKQNVQLSREGMAFEGDQATKQMQFQERMSGSSYQRATEDMRLAGINPMLAYMQGGASTPGGAAASGAAATVQDVVGPAVASAQHARRLSQELKNMREQEMNIRHQTYEVTSRELLNKAQETESEARTRNVNSQTALNAASLPQAQAAGRLYGGRFGTAFSVADRLFGGRSLQPLSLRR